jgi:acyl-homoserine lactone acylase PvdQ
MAVHNPPARGKLNLDVYHGPAFRWVVDLADPLHFKFVIAGGNGGQVTSEFLKNSYRNWLDGGFYDMTLIRSELEVTSEQLVGNSKS